jgi:uncharacterized membrane protein required for colicin V production
LNLVDLIIIAILAVFGILGLKRGFFLSIIKIASFFVSILIAIKLYPLLSKVIRKTVFYVNVKAAIINNLILKKKELDPTGGANQTSGNIIDSLPLPEFLKSFLEKGTASAAQGYAELVDQISTELANLVCDIISVIILFIAAKLVFILLGFLFKGIAKLPIFKQLDKVGGFALGAVEGLLMIYILLAVLTITSANPKMEKILNAVDNSLIGHRMYQNNFIVSSVLGKSNK